nr:mediator of RNA polymerase II transcription subunit 19-like [Ciona intestinalis]|eukprot:XP_026689716.1 mediator of RNA polymerase II transcription subunit 19-like [Ciona intestinalis]
MMEFPNSNFHFDQTQTLLDSNTANFGTNHDIVKSTHSSSLYLLKPLPPPAQVTGSTNLLAHFGLESTYNKFCGKKLKETLSSFLPHLPGVTDGPAASNGSSLRSVIDKPPIVGSKEIQPLSSGVLMSAFRLHPGPLPEQYRPLHQQNESRRKPKHKKNRPDPVSLDQRGPELESKKHKKRKHEDGDKKKRKKEKKRKREREKERM